ncbi:hypothetical protein LXL04_028860 [Taraxacum kok-saghyz]
MEETELEEGEACFDDNDACIDPDTALSYIDERLQNVLGHFQKYFEGEGCAEMLGPIFGGYGSFLPVHKQLPTLHSHIKTPQTVQIPNKSCLQGPPLNSTRPPANSSSHVSKNETTTSNPRSLKVRIKVGCDKSARKNAAIYSGLGLSSPSSSMGNDHEDSDGIPLDSPATILHNMTSILVPGNRLLSPLNESLLCLPKMERIIENKPKPPIMGRKFGIVDDSSCILMNGNEVSSQEKSEMEGTKCKESRSVPLSRKDLKVNLSFDSALWKENQAVKKDVPVKKKETNRDHDVKHSSSEETKTKKLSLDSKTKGKTVHSVSKNDPDASKHVEKKPSLKAMTLEPHEVKVPLPPHGITKLPLERKSKLTGIQTMKDKKSAQKDIVRVRNSYKDMLDTRVNDENTLRKMPPTGNCELGAVKEKEKEKDIPINGVVADPLQIPVPPDNWVACDRCEKWRLLPAGIVPENLPDKWICSMSTWLPGRNNCDISEDETTRAIQEMNLHLMSQNHNILQFNNAAADNIRHSAHITTSEAMTSRLKKETTSHLSQKRKSLSETNQQLVNKSNNFVMGRHAAKVNGKDVDEGDLKPKKLKNKTGSDLSDHVTSGKIKNEAASDTDGYRDRLVISVKRQTESTELSMKSSEKVDIKAKKRKLKDWEESESSDKVGRKEKRLKSCNTEIKDNDGFTLKVKTMKVILPGNTENSVDRKKLSLEVGATSSSSKVSDSCRRVSLIEGKGSPVGSVSSSPIRALNVTTNLSSTISRKSVNVTQIPRKLLPNTKGISVIDESQKLGGKVEMKHKEPLKMMENNTNGGMKESLLKSRENDKKSNFQRVRVKALTEQEPFPNKMRKVEVDVDLDRSRSSMNPEYSNDSDKKGILGKKISRRRTGGSIIGDEKEKEKEKPTSLMDHGGFEPKKGDIGSSEVKKDSKKMLLGDLPKKRDSNDTEQKLEGGNLSNSTTKDLGVISFVKEYASSQTAMTAFKRAEESKDYADRIKMSGFDYECKDAYFDSALKFLYAASLLEASSIDFNKPKGVDPVNAYTTSAKLSKNCGEEYEKQKEMGAASLAYKCMEVAYMRIVYCKSLVSRQDLQTSLQMVNQGESPSSSASDVDNLNNGMEKSVLSKSIAAHPGNYLVARNQANFFRLLDFTSDVNLAMEACTNTQNCYKAAVSMTQESPNKEMMHSIKRVVEFSFQDVKQVVLLVQNAREAINRQGFFKGNNNKRE